MQRGASSMSYFESRELPRGRLPHHVRALHAGARLTGRVPLDARLDRGPLSFEHGLDRAVPEVPNVPAQPELLRLLLAVRPEVHALHEPPEYDASAGGRHARIEAKKPQIVFGPCGGPPE